MLDLSNLSTESYASFILAIVFTIITLAGAIFILRRSFKTSTLVKVLTTIVFPFIAIFCWIYMILNTCANFDVVKSLYSSFLITLAFFAVVIGVYYLTLFIIKKKKEHDIAYVKSLENEVNDLENELNEKEKNSADIVITEIPANEENVEETVIEPENEEVSAQNEEIEEVGTQNEEESQEENTEIEEENEESTEENEETDNSQNKEENVEESENDEIIEVNDENTDEVIIPNEENLEPTNDENNENNNKDDENK